MALMTLGHKVLVVLVAVQEEVVAPLAVMLVVLGLLGRVMLAVLVAVLVMPQVVAEAVLVL